MAEDAIIAIQDMGAAGLTSSSVEMAGKGGLGMELDLDAVPVREDAMTAYEIMLSESQERMLLVLKPESEARARKIFERWGLDFSIIGRLTNTGQLVIKKDGAIQANIPIDPMVDQSPEYDRPWEATPRPSAISASDVPAPSSLTETLATLLASPDLASRRWIWEQFDHLIMNDTIVRPGGDAAVVRVRDTNKGLAMSVDCTPRYCVAHPETGGAQAVAEAWRNLTASGATPLALTNNMNFGNPERPRIMGQFIGCIAGMRKAAKVLDFPVVSGNVSLYNETDGEAILPTPVIGGVGVMADVSKHATVAFKKAGEAIVLVGETTGWLGQSIYLREIERREEGAPPPVDLDVEKANGDFTRDLIEQNIVSACHDLSDGGIAVAVAEMALASTGLGAALDISGEMPAHAQMFGEDQARYLVTTDDPEIVTGKARAANVPAYVIGHVSDDGQLTLGPGDAISLDMLRSGHEGWLPCYMRGA
jgi:phosphoribosylformylglycinamidine synthase